MPTKLKPTVRQFKPIEREKLEEIELKPSKIQKSVIDKDTLEDVALNPVPKDITDEGQVAEISEYIEATPEVEKRIIKKVIKVKKPKDKEDIQDVEDSTILDVKEVEEVSHQIRYFFLTILLTEHHSH